MTRFWRLAFLAAIAIAILGLLYLVVWVAIAIEQLDLWQ
jgi:hypothetical protein